MDVATFRLALPQFDVATFPDATVQYWLNIGIGKLDPQLWGDRLDEGLLYYTAHTLTLAQRAMQGGTGGTQGIGPVASKSIGPASVSYDNAAVISAGAGSFNSTVWGMRYWELVQMVGAGGLQLMPGAPISPMDGLNFPFGTGYW